MHPFVCRTIVSACGLGRWPEGAWRLILLHLQHLPDSPHSASLPAAVPLPFSSWLCLETRIKIKRTTLNSREPNLHSSLDPAVSDCGEENCIQICSTGFYESCLFFSVTGISGQNYQQVSAGQMTQGLHVFFFLALISFLIFKKLSSHHLQD